jgi:hypothetical protein
MRPPLRHRWRAVPGFKSLKQLEENIAATAFGPMSAEDLHEIERILRPGEWAFAVNIPHREPNRRSG